MKNLLQIRATGILIENGKILLVKQKVSSSRFWSLPGGHLEQGETLKEAIFRELHEETGLLVKVKKLLYICDVPEVSPPLVHITFLLDKVSGEVRLPTNEFDKNTILDVKMVEIDRLHEYGFSELFISLILEGFPMRAVIKG